MGPQPDPGGDRGRGGFFLELGDELKAAVADAILNREPEIPPAADHLWEWFWDLHRGRQAGMGGWLALSALEMKSWEAMTGNDVRREEWKILRDMDQAFLDAARAQGKDGAPIASSSNEMTPDAFDAVFG